MSMIIFDSIDELSMAIASKDTQTIANQEPIKHKKISAKKILIYFNQYDPDSTYAALIQCIYLQQTGHTENDIDCKHYNRFACININGYDHIFFIGVDISPFDVEEFQKKKIKVFFSDIPGYYIPKMERILPIYTLDVSVLYNETHRDSKKAWVFHVSTLTNIYQHFAQAIQSNGSDPQKLLKQYNLNNVLDLAFFMPIQVNTKDMNSKQAINARLEETSRAWSEHRVIAAMLQRETPNQSNDYRENTRIIRNLLMNGQRIYNIKRGKHTMRISCFASSEAIFRDMCRSALAVERNVVGYEDTKWGKVWRFFSPDWLNIAAAGENFFSNFKTKALWMEGPISCALSNLDTDFLK